MRKTAFWRQASQPLRGNSNLLPAVAAETDHPGFIGPGSGFGSGSGSGGGRRGSSGPSGGMGGLGGRGAGSSGCGGGGSVGEPETSRSESFRSWRFFFKATRVSQLFLAAPSPLACRATIVSRAKVFAPRALALYAVTTLAASLDGPQIRPVRTLTSSQIAGFSKPDRLAGRRFRFPLWFAIRRDEKSLPGCLAEEEILPGATRR